MKGSDTTAKNRKNRNTVKEARKSSLLKEGEAPDTAAKSANGEGGGVDHKNSTAEMAACHDST